MSDYEIMRNAQLAFLEYWYNEIVISQQNANGAKHFALSLECISALTVADLVDFSTKTGLEFRLDYLRDGIIFDCVGGNKYVAKKYMPKRETLVSKKN